MLNRFMQRTRQWNSPEVMDAVLEYEKTKTDLQEAQNKHQAAIQELGRLWGFDWHIWSKGEADACVQLWEKIAQESKLEWENP